MKRPSRVSQVSVPCASHTCSPRPTISSLPRPHLWHDTPTPKWPPESLLCDPSYPLLSGPPETEYGTRVIRRVPSLASKMATKFICPGHSWKTSQATQSAPAMPLLIAHLFYQKWKYLVEICSRGNDLESIKNLQLKPLKKILVTIVKLTCMGHSISHCWATQSGFSGLVMPKVCFGFQNHFLGNSLDEEKIMRKFFLVKNVLVENFFCCKIFSSETV